MWPFYGNQLLLLSLSASLLAFVNLCGGKKALSTCLPAGNRRNVGNVVFAPMQIIRRWLKY